MEFFLLSRIFSLNFICLTGIFFNQFKWIRAWYEEGKTTRSTNKVNISLFSRNWFSAISCEVEVSLKILWCYWDARPCSEIDLSEALFMKMSYFWYVALKVTNIYVFLWCVIKRVHVNINQRWVILLSATLLRQERNNFSPGPLFVVQQKAWLIAALSKMWSNLFW